MWRRIPLFKKLKLRTKLLVVLMIPISALVVSVLSGINILQTVSSSYVRSLYEECFESSVLILNADRDLYQALNAFYELMRDETGTGYERITTTLRENLQEAEDRIVLAQDTLRGNWEKINSVRHPDSGRTMADNFVVFFNSFAAWQKVLDFLSERWRQEQLAPRPHEIANMEREFATAREALNQFGELLEIYAENNIKEKQTEIALYRRNILYFNLFNLALSLIIGLIIIRNITTFLLKGIRAHLKKVAQGDLRLKFSTKRQDELGEMARELNKTTEEIASILRSIRESSSEVNNAAYEISMANTDLSQRTQEEAATLEEISATIEEMSASIQLITNNASQANSFSLTTLNAVENGETFFKETFETMKAIADSNLQIAEIIKMVDDIAFQTNLLALNAAVEAARAGEHGKGFAVVAAEVRKLARMAAEAATKIEELIAASVQRTEHGNRLVQNSTEILEQIVTNTKRTAELFQEVTNAVEEQADATQQIKSSIEQLNEVTQQNAAMVEEISSSSELLRNKAEDLYKLVNRFKTADGQATNTQGVQAS